MYMTKAYVLRLLVQELVVVLEAIIKVKAQVTALQNIRLVILLILTSIVVAEVAEAILIQTHLLRVKVVTEVQTVGTVAQEVLEVTPTELLGIPVQGPEVLDTPLIMAVAAVEDIAGFITEMK